MSLQYYKENILPISDKLFRFALRIVGDRSEAEDVVQEVMIKIWNKRKDWEFIDNMEAWCVKMTRNLSIDKLRSKHRRTQDLDGLFHLKDAAATPLETAERNDTIHHITRLMQELPEAQRLVMQLRDIEELSYKEIMEQLDMTMPQVKTNLFRARNKIKKRLNKTFSDHFCGQRFSWKNCD
ncbi:MAG: sigma-70 family RNA polymerase sigma factor [Saprospiraceae bacterium]|nr:sigma-70 family RNA polymerase sigma factor [Saprospiraceae bacterium]